MMVNLKKVKLLASTAFMITLATSQVQAFPLLCSDPSRLVASARVTMQEVMIIKQEIESNMQIVTLIANGGFAQAGAMIFNKIQSGEYDRFGKSLSNVKSNTLSMAQNVKEREERAKREKELRAQGMSEKLAKEKARQESAERLAKAQQERERAAEEAKANRGSNMFNNSYNWLKDNKTFTSGASNALNGVANGNWGQTLSGATNATGGALNSNGDTTLGNIFNNASSGAGNALNSALDGNWGNVINSGAGVTGNVISGATGSEGTGNTIGSLGGIAAGTYNTFDNSGSAGETISGLFNNRDIQSGLSGVQNGYNQTQTENANALAAQEEADRQAAEELKKSMNEAGKQMQAQLKQQACQRCKEENKAAGRDEMTGCVTVCSY